MARRRAVCSNHAAGRSGTPSTGHRCSASITASCTRSSARSKSPVMRTSDPQMSPTSSRNTALIASPVGLLNHRPLRPTCSAVRMIGHGIAVGDHGTDLDALILWRPALRDRNCLVEVRRVDGDESCDVLLALHEGTVGHELASLAPANRGRGARGLELLGAEAL